ncbi:hypothetical protein A7U60_g5242 [Sanghuangporus baumii]|uniref:Uncharacterized protein n=1 Tax=Sanghuangporus baumii TaxID=108892 RepID=A0A9Q5HX99_SANBA|nr:hypothetical protein A7U60_g5242 [Sanghuangporus baumii]
MATDVKHVVNNPFRSQPVTPNPTGAGPSGSTEPPPQPDSQTQSEVRRTDPVTPAAAGSPARERDPSLRRQDRRSADDLAAELQSTTLDDSTPAEPPPAYTPSANPYEGEATVEYGPRRPFQSAPPPPPLPHQFTGMSGASVPLHPQYSGFPQGSPYISPQGTGMPMMSTPTGGWNAYPDQGMSSSASLGRYGAPPRHPSLSANSHTSTSAASIRPAPTGDGMSEFARDFYSSPPERRSSPALSNASSDGGAGPEHFERLAPPTITTSSSAPSTTYPPPNVPPSPTSPALPSSAYARPSGPPPPRTSTDSAEDCKPTTTPTPGRPLLNKGRVLVYPSGYECKKCLNTGYKSFDPTHPCRKCWEKYSKLYTGAIVYAPRSSQSQRPLPNLKPPHLGHQHSESQSSSSSSHLRPQSAYQSSLSPWQGYPGRVASTSCLGAGLGRTGPGLGGGYRPAPNVNFTRGMPPPGSVVVRPGDPRIGGRLCWRCDGSGQRGQTSRVQRVFHVRSCLLTAYRRQFRAQIRGERGRSYACDPVPVYARSVPRGSIKNGCFPMVVLTGGLFFPSRLLIFRFPFGLTTMRFALRAAYALTAATLTVALPLKRWSSEIPDDVILNFALTLEHLEAAFYQEGLALFDEAAFEAAGFPAFARGRIVQISENEQTHVSVLSGILGPGATQPCNYSFPLTDVSSFVDMSAIFEGVGTAAYTGAANLLADPSHVTEAASILATEARQAAWVMSAVKKQNPWSTSFEANMNQAFSLAAAFITSCPSTNPSLPVSAFPPLSVTSANNVPGGSITVSFDPSANEIAESNTPLFLALLTGLRKLFVPLSSNADGTWTATLPGDLQGTVYALVTNNNGWAADYDTVAGVALLQSPFDSQAHILN